jgi:hypothetical protein
MRHPHDAHWTIGGCFTPRRFGTRGASCRGWVTGTVLRCEIKGFGFSVRIAIRLLSAVRKRGSGPPGPETLKTVPQPPLFVYGQDESVPPQRVVP